MGQVRGNDMNATQLRDLAYALGSLYSDLWMRQNMSTDHAALITAHAAPALVAEFAKEANRQG